MHPPEKPNPTTGQDGRAGIKMSFGRLRDKQDRNYSDQSDFASGETALGAKLREAFARKAVAR